MKLRSEKPTESTETETEAETEDTSRSRLYVAWGVLALVAVLLGECIGVALRHITGSDK